MQLVDVLKEDQVNIIVRPITDDGEVGYDEFDQFTWNRKEGKYTVSSMIADVRGKTCVI